MASISTSNTDHVIRSNLWSNQLKDVLQDELIAMKYVEWLSDFPDGDTINIPSVGEAEVLNYDEGQAIRYSGLDTGNLTLTVTSYKASATSVSNKMKQDSFYMDRIASMFVPKQERAIMKVLETDILALGPNGQTSADPNTINGGRHRFVGAGTGDTMALGDFAKALYALEKANVPMKDLIAIVDPSVEFAFNNITNLTNVSNNPRWEGIISSGISSGMKFVKNVFGFDVYVSQNLKSGMSETVSGNSITNGVANLFFSATSDMRPFMGVMRQPPMVDSSYNKDLQQDEYVTTCRYGLKLKRPENLVVVLTDNSQVYA